MLRTVVRVLVVIVIAGSILLILIAKRTDHKVIVTSYLSDARGLRAEAPVRIAGVDVGSVRSVRVRPEAKEEPVEIVMLLTPSYDLRIPNDATVALSSAGILGETYVNIDASAASGSPIGANAVLRSKPSAELSAEQMMGKLGELIKKNCDCDCKKNPTNAEKRVSRNSN